MSTMLKAETIHHSGIYLLVKTAAGEVDLAPLIVNQPDKLFETLISALDEKAMIAFINAILSNTDLRKTLKGYLTDDMALEDLESENDELRWENNDLEEQNENLRKALKQARAVAS